MARPLYRSRQVLQAVWPRLDESKLGLVDDVLSENEAALFLAMHRRDQRHALEVAGRLQAHRVTDRELLAAALLHDCGKDHAPVWLRILNVLSPATLRRLASDETPGWRRSAFHLAYHAEIGAERAATAGAAEATVRFIRGDVLPEDEARMALLRAADDAS